MVNKNNIHYEEFATESNVSNTLQVEWTREHEVILIEWADKSMCYRWLHSKAHNNVFEIKYMVYYSSYNNLYAYRNC